MDTNDIISAIRSGSWTFDEINDIIQAGINARSQLGRQKMRGLRPGMTVRFTSNRTGHVYQGTVVETKLKNVVVQTPGGRYRVPASMLETV